ncbi:hypothetical protein KBD20_01440 [Candidatus Saccharibacteria bacterium]|nr:hypothetical protein [Candidatus Saccharibacteria bacterium]
MNRLKTYAREPRLWLVVQAVALSWGNFVGWSTIYRDVQVYCLNEAKGLDALLSFSGSVTTNPLLSPCFWGTLSFTACLLWTLRLLLMKDTQKRAREHKHLLTLLMASTAFAAVNNVPLFYRFYTTPRGTAASCSVGKLMTNPFATSCFYGFSAFLLATLSGLGLQKYAVTSKK